MKKYFIQLGINVLILICIFLFFNFKMNNTIDKINIKNLNKLVNEGNGVLKKLSDYENMETDFKLIKEELKDLKNITIKKTDLDYVSQAIISFKETVLSVDLKKVDTNTYTMEKDDGFMYGNLILKLNMNDIEKSEGDLKLGLVNSIIITEIVNIYPYGHVETKLIHNIPESHIKDFKFRQHYNKCGKFWDYLYLPFSLETDFIKDEIKFRGRYGIGYKSFSLQKLHGKNAYLLQYNLKFINLKFSNLKK